MERDHTPGNPVVLCLPDTCDRERVDSLVDRLRDSGREVLVATRPLQAHRAGRCSSFMEKLGARLKGRRVHWVGLEASAEDTFNTLSGVSGVASLVLLEPELQDQEPSHPGRGDVPKLLVRRSSRSGGSRRNRPPARFLGNIVGPVEIKVIRSEEDEAGLPQVILDFIDRADRSTTEPTT